METIRLDKMALKPGNMVRLPFLNSPVYPTDAYNIQSGSDEGTNRYDIGFWKNVLGYRKHYISDYISTENYHLLVLEEIEQYNTYRFRIFDNPGLHVRVNGSQVVYPYFNSDLFDETTNDLFTLE